MNIKLKEIPEKVEKIINTYQADRLKVGQRLNQELVVYAIIKEYDEMKNKQVQAK